MMVIANEVKLAEKISNKHAQTNGLIKIKITLDFKIRNYITFTHFHVTYNLG
jgi:hypothetical protein